MLDVLLFGATGYTGRLTAHALARRGASFAVAGRRVATLESLAAATGARDARPARVGDAAGLAAALHDVKVLLTCVGPFTDLGDTAVDAALAAGVHYVDSCGEAGFVRRLIDEKDGAARSSGVALAPSMGFDEGAADAAATIATRGMTGADLDITYALPSRASAGTVRSGLRGLTAPGIWLEDGRTVPVTVGGSARWAPMPPPLGPRRALAAHLPEVHLAPLHLDVAGARTHVTAGALARGALRASGALQRVCDVGVVRRAAESALLRVMPRDDHGRPTGASWTILAEARDEKGWRKVALSGADAYGITAELLASGACRLAADAHGLSGVVSPVQTLGLETLMGTLADRSVTLRTYELR